MGSHRNPSCLRRLPPPPPPPPGSNRKLVLVTKSSNSSNAAERCPMLDLLRGHPSTGLLPTAAIYEAAGVALNSPRLLPPDSKAADSRHPLHYGPDQGNLVVREEIARWTSERYRLKRAISP